MGASASIQASSTSSLTNPSPGQLAAFSKMNKTYRQMKEAEVSDHAMFEKLKKV